MQQMSLLIFLSPVFICVTSPNSIPLNPFTNSGIAPIDSDQGRARGQISDLVPECLGLDRQGRGQMRQCQY